MDTKDSRYADDRSTTRRRRECPKCGVRITTYEIDQERLLALEKAEIDLKNLVGLVVPFLAVTGNV